MKKLTMPGKIAAFLGVLLVLWGLKWTIVDSGLIPKKVKQSTVIAINDLPPLKYDKNANAPLGQLPSENPANIQALEFRAGIMGWNAQMGVMAANGGPVTTEGSFMAQQGVNLKLICQNDCGKQGEGLYAFIQDYAKGNKSSSKGYNMIAWMGDGCPSYLAGLNDQIKKQIGPEYIAQVFYSCGSSFGEDKFIFADDNPNAKVKQDAVNALKGALIVGVIRDGDWNIAMKFCQLNNIKVNNDLTTYDPDAVNWVSSDDYVKAAQAYVSRTKNTRKIVRNGKLTKRDTTVTINGCVTWFPGDKTAFSGRGGVTVASTVDFAAQMPCAFIASKKWLQDNRDQVEKFILASSLGGDQVKSHGTWLTFGAKVSDEVYQDNTMKPKDWEDAYKSVDYTDPNGVVNKIGGSRVWNLADDAQYFGFGGAGADMYNLVYTAFGDLDVQAYPEIVPSYPKYDEVVDLTYMEDVWNKNKNNANMTAASTPTFKAGETGTQKVADANYSIEFDFGSANIRPTSYKTLDLIGQNAAISSNLYVNIIGHTDDIGDADKNRTLSKERADAVLTYLNGKFPKVFDTRTTTDGVGYDQPLFSTPAENTTTAGRQKNRRVEVMLKR